MCMNKLIPSPKATAEIIKAYIERMYEIELDDTDTFYIRGLINERDVEKQRQYESNFNS